MAPFVSSLSRSDGEVAASPCERTEGLFVDAERTPPVVGSHAPLPPLRCAASHLPMRKRARGGDRIHPFNSASRCDSQRRPSRMASCGDPAWPGAMAFHRASSNSG